MTKWSRFRLGDVCEIIAGQSPPGSSYNTRGEGLAFYQGKKEFGTREIRQATTWTTKPTKIAEVGDILMSVRAPVGPVNFLNERACIGRGLAAIRPSERIDRNFLFYNLLMREPEIAGTEGAVFASINRSEIAALEICSPPIEEQRGIVTILHGAFAAIATATTNAEKNLLNARELFEAELDAVIEEARGKFPGRALADHCRRVTVGHVGPMKDRYQSSGIPFLRSQNVRPFQIELAGVAFIDKKFDAELAKSRLTPGDVAVVRTGYPGTAAVIPETLPGCNCADLVIIRPGADLDPHYLAAFLNSNLGKRMIAGNLVGAAQKHFNVGAAKNVPIPLPPLVAQQHFARRVEEMRRMSDRIANIYQAKLAHLAALKQSLLHRAFAGELSERAIALPATANDNFATPEFAAQILAFAHSRHVGLGRAANFGHVKAQKTLHAVEAIGGLDLGRQPIKDAAGPNDFAHMRQAEHWARQEGFFEFVERANGGYDFRQLQNYERLLGDAKQKLERAGATATRAVELLVDMDSEFAEIVVTTHAAWNNLILDQARITDDAIVQAARDDWHQDKLRYDKSRFHDAIRFIRSNGIEPNGSAKRVGGQESLPL